MNYKETHVFKQYSERNCIITQGDNQRHIRFSHQPFTIHGLLSFLLQSYLQILVFLHGSLDLHSAVQKSTLQLTDHHIRKLFLHESPFSLVLYWFALYWFSLVYPLPKNLRSSLSNAYWRKIKIQLRWLQSKDNTLGMTGLLERDWLGASGCLLWSTILIGGKRICLDTWRGLSGNTCFCGLISVRNSRETTSRMKWPLYQHDFENLFLQWWSQWRGLYVTSSWIYF